MNHKPQDIRPESLTTKRDDDVNSETKNISRASANTSEWPFVASVAILAAAIIGAAGIGIHPSDTFEPRLNRKDRA